MKAFFALVMLTFIGLAGWRIGGQLSSDAVGMALGILFGIMAGLPTALILLAARRRDDDDGYDRRGRGRQQLPAHGYASPYGAPGYQPPVIVVTGNGGALPNQQPGGMGQQRPGLPGPAEMPVEARQFRVVGETDEWVEEW